MKKNRVNPAVILVLAVLFIWSGCITISYAQLVEEITPPGGGKGRIDFEEGYIYATAIGTADMSQMVNRVQAKQVALTTARHLCYGVLSETVNSVGITGKAIYRKRMLVDDGLKVETEGVIRNAHVWKEDFTWTTNGDAEATVTIRMPINGGLSKVASRWVQKNHEMLPRVEAGNADSASEKYTGLIVDASGISVKPVVSPRVLTSKGTREVYGPGIADFNTGGIEGFAGYARSVEKASANQRVGSHPLVVKAESTYGTLQGDIVISEGDAKKIASADIGAEFLKRCKVVIVVN